MGRTAGGRQRVPACREEPLVKDESSMGEPCLLFSKALPLKATAVLGGKAVRAAPLTDAPGRRGAERSG